MMKSLGAILFMFVSLSLHAADCGGALVTTNFIGAKIAEFNADQFRVEDEPELRAAGVDIVYVNSPSPADRQRLKESDGFYYKSKWMTWTRPALDRDAFLASLKSKERSRIRTKLKNSLGRVDAFEAPLTVAAYREWHKIYAEEMEKKERGRVARPETWADEKGEDLKLYRRIFFHDRETQELIGGVLLRPDLAHNSLQAPYAAYREKFRDYDIPLRSFIEVMDRAVALGLKEVNYGRDTNLYGHHLSVGLMEYKASLGFIPSPGKEKQIIKVLNPAILNNDYFFFALRGKNIVPQHFTDTPRALILPPGMAIQPTKF